MSLILLSLVTTDAEERLLSPQILGQLQYGDGVGTHEQCSRDAHELGCPRSTRGITHTNSGVTRTLHINTQSIYTVSCTRMHSPHQHPQIRKNLRWRRCRRGEVESTLGGTRVGVVHRAPSSIELGVEVVSRERVVGIGDEAVGAQARTVLNASRWRLALIRAYTTVDNFVERSNCGSCNPLHTTHHFSIRFRPNLDSH